MSSFVIESKGFDKLISDMDGYIEDLNRKTTETMNRAGNAVIDYARANHRYKTQSGQLEAATQFEYDRHGNRHEARIFINDSFLETKKGSSYGVFIHEGTYQGYNQSPIAPLYSNSISASGSGWESDPFLWEAIRIKWKLKTRLSGVMKRLQKKYERK